MENMIISFSGGRTSAYITWWLHNNLSHRFNFTTVFANTRKEREETLKFVDDFSKYFGIQVVWLEAVVYQEWRKGVGFKVVNYETADTIGNVFESVIAKHGIPNRNFPHCSREMKGRVIRKFSDKIMNGRDYLTAIGIRSDEPKRLSWDKAKKERIVYPLAQWSKVTKSDVNKFWNQQPFDLELKSYEGNCDLCWKKSKRKLLTILKENPKLGEWWTEMERKYGDYSPAERPKRIFEPLTFFREGASALELLEESELPFDPAVDESKDIDPYKQAYLWEQEYDENFGCSESCEAF